MQRITLALTLALLATLTSPARAGDVYPDGIGDFADAVVKSLADWQAVYGDCDPAKPPPPGSVCAPASSVIEGGSSTLRRRSVTTCGAWGRCACWDPDDFFPSRERLCCTTTSWDGVPGSVTICVREVASCGGGPETECW